jgi:hypothetical protein
LDLGEGKENEKELAELLRNSVILFGIFIDFVCFPSFFQDPSRHSMF